MAGSVLGGRFSDHELARRTAANGGKPYPEVGHFKIVRRDILLMIFEASFEKQHIHCFLISSICGRIRVGLRETRKHLCDLRHAIFLWFSFDVRTLEQV